MISQYISSGEWKAADSDSLLASKSYYTMRLRALFNLRFRYASSGATYSPSLSFLVEKTNFHANKEKRITLQKMVTILEGMHEVSHVEVEKKLQGRKILDAILHIHPSDSFIQTMIANNRLTKRTQDALILDEHTALIEPLPSDYDNERDYRKAQDAYRVARGKHLYKQYRT